MEHVTEIKQEDYQILPNDNTLATISKAEIDMQIATAKAFPRSFTEFLRKTESMATASTGIAESCTYALPRKEKDKTGKWVEKFIKGPSVRLAEIVCASYGNIRAGARVLGNDGKHVTAQGFCHDLESNTFIALEVKRKITNKNGERFSEDMIVVTGNAACKIAFRNAAFSVIPAALLTDVYEKIQEVARGTAETLEARRNKAVAYFTKLGITEAQICEVLLIKDIKDIDLDKLEILSGMKSVIVNQESTIEELFPSNDQKDKANKAANLTEKEMQELKIKQNQNKP